VRWQRTVPGGTILDYLGQPEPAARWSTLLSVANEALVRWLGALAEPIRRSDAARPLTVGYNDLLLASLPANQALDFISWHQYPPADDSAPIQMATLLMAVGARLSRPVVLGEFGWATSEQPAARAADLETATLRELRRSGLAGGLKWMLNDVAGAESTREGSYGLFAADGSPKPSAEALRKLALSA